MAKNKKFRQHNKPTNAKPANVQSTNTKTESMISQLREKFWNGYNVFENFPNRLFDNDMQGWSSQHPYLTEVIEEKRPQVIVEIGVWKGGSSITMANKLKELNINGVVIAVDTWLGSWDHWLNPDLKNELCFSNGYPRLYDKFLSNVVNAGCQDFIVPLPLDSMNACYVVIGAEVKADVIHIDGGHGYMAARSDLTCWWQALKIGGVLIMDDYVENGAAWEEVYRATNDFLETVPHENFVFKEGKCRCTKLGEIES